MGIGNMARNDLAAAKAFYAKRGEITADDLHMLLMLQDDADELMELAESWTVVESYTESE